MNLHIASVSLWKFPSSGASAGRMTYIFNHKSSKAQVLVSANGKRLVVDEDEIRGDLMEAASKVLRFLGAPVNGGFSKQIEMEKLLKLMLSF